MKPLKYSYFKKELMKENLGPNIAGQQVAKQ